MSAVSWWHTCGESGLMSTASLSIEELHWNASHVALTLMYFPVLLGEGILKLSCLLLWANQSCAPFRVQDCIQSLDEETRVLNFFAEPDESQPVAAWGVEQSEAANGHVTTVVTYFRAY